MSAQAYIILLRGVMPTGKNKVPMARLREVLTSAGFANVRTYIQTGNVLLSSPTNGEALAARMAALIKERIGPDLAVVVRKPAEIERVLKGNPFGAGHDIARVFYVLFAAPPPKEKVAALVAADYGAEKLVVTGDAAYLYIPGQYGKGKLSAAILERKLGVSATMRNDNTMRKLVELSTEG
ncbi:MAG: DUF1697 domain-containing protein [Nitrospinae bacterium]|nr:DUF1697 domain-containing protein [Nitrospinota bacterium]